MITAFHRWHKNFKSALFLGILAFVLFANFLIFISPLYEKIHSLQREKIKLNAQWQQRHAAAVHQQQLQQDILVLQYPYLTLLQSMRKPMTPAELYTQIALLAKTHSLQIIGLKPQKNQSTAGLNELIFNLDITGTERKILNFLQLLMHQSWLLEIQQLEFTPTTAGIYLQATVAAYYAT